MYDRKELTAVILSLALVCFLYSGCNGPYEPIEPDETNFGQVDLAGAVIVADRSIPIHVKASDMLADEIEKRTRVRLDEVTSLPRGNAVRIVLGTVDKFPIKKLSVPSDLSVPNTADSYSIWVNRKKGKAVTIYLLGRDNRGMLFAVGRLLRRLNMSRDKVTLDSGYSIATAPEFPIRGHQQAYRPKTNSYDGWDIDMWEQSFRDLIVFGTNAVEILPPRTDDDPDSPHFPKPPMEMMIEKVRVLDEYDLDVWIWFPAIDKDYTDDATVKASLEEWGEVFSKLQRIDAVFVPGGDPGNTHPKVLMPFMEKQAKNLHRYHPKAQMWVSPQGFDRKGRNREGWMKIFLEILQTEQPQWLDGVVFGPQVALSLAKLREEVPAKYPIRRYPDITHSRGSQYQIKDWDMAFNRTLGRETITYRPYGFAKIFRDPKRYALGEKGRGLAPIDPRPDEDTNVFIDPKKYSIGFITYSEGCNDDFNKVLWSCLGWDREMNVKDIAKEYSKYFISDRFEERFAQGIIGLEKNWDGPILENDNIEKTLLLFRHMENDATPQERLNWRFQMALYRAYYDAYIKERLPFETKLEKEAIEVLKNAKDLGSLAAMNQAEEILDTPLMDQDAMEYRTRAFALAEGLFQSIRMQLSVEKYQAIHLGRGANLDSIDYPFSNRKQLREVYKRLRRKPSMSEEERLKKIADVLLELEDWKSRSK
jgi:hypothetical protein